MINQDYKNIDTSNKTPTLTKLADGLIFGSALAIAIYYFFFYQEIKMNNDKKAQPQFNKRREEHEKTRYGAPVRELLAEPEHEDLSELRCILGPNFCEDCD